MNTADTELEAAFVALLEISGDVLTLRGSPVSAVIDRTKYPEPQDKRFPDLTTRASSRIEILKSAVAYAPKSGEVFIEGTTRHRIQRVTDAGTTYQVECEVGA